MKGDYERAVSNLTESLRLRPGYEWAKERLEMSKQDLARVQREQEQTTRREDESGSASVACPQCQTQLTVPSFCVGRKVKCPCCLLRLCRFAHRLNPTIVHPAAKCVMRDSLALFRAFGNNEAEACKTGRFLHCFRTLLTKRGYRPSGEEKS